MKKIISVLLLVVLICCSASTVFAQWESDYEQRGFPEEVGIEPDPDAPLVGEEEFWMRVNLECWWFEQLLYIGEKHAEILIDIFKK